MKLNSTELNQGNENKLLLHDGLQPMEGSLQHTPHSSSCNPVIHKSSRPWHLLMANCLLILAMLLGMGDAWGQKTDVITRSTNTNTSSGGNITKVSNQDYTHTWTVPSGVTKIKVHGIGGGGGGGKAYAKVNNVYYAFAYAAGSGGGGGAYDVETFTVVPNSVCTLRVGKGGSQQQNGESSWFKLSGSGTNIIQANYGSAGTSASITNSNNGSLTNYSDKSHIVTTVGSGGSVYNNHIGGKVGSDGGKATSSSSTGWREAKGGNGGKAGGNISESGNGGDGGTADHTSTDGTQKDNGDGGNSYGGGGGGGAAIAVSVGSAGVWGIGVIKHTREVTGNGGSGADGIVWVQYINATISKHEDVKCYGKSTGSIKIKMTAYGSETQYKYKWTSSDNRKSGTSADEWVSFNVNSSHEFIIDGLKGSEAGITYTVTIKEINSGCECTGTATIKQPTELKFTQEVAYSRVSCHHSNDIPEGSYKYDDGKVTVYASGGTPPLNYELATTAAVVATFEDEQGTIGHYQFTGLKAGSVQTYTVTVTDGNSCSITNNQIKVPEPPELIISAITPHPLDCSTDGWIAVTFEGGTNTTGDTVRWDAHGGQGSGFTPGLNSGHNNSYTYTIQNITIPQSYDITVIDNNQCSVTEQNVVILDRESPWPTNWPKDPQPQYTRTVCNNTPFTITAGNMGLENMSDLFFNWTVEDCPASVTGAGAGNFKTSLTDTLNNSSNVVQSVTYRVRALKGVYCYSDWYYVKVDVRPGSGAEVSFEVADIPDVCPGSEVTITTTFSNVSSGMTAQWKFNGETKEEANITATSYTQTFAAPTDCATASYPYQVIVSNAYCSTNKEAFVKVNAGALTIDPSEYKTKNVSCYSEVEAPSASILNENNFVLSCGNYTSEPADVEGQPIRSRSTFNDCNDTITYTYTYKACNDSTAIWKYIYYLNDNKGPELLDGYADTVGVVNDNCVFTYPDLRDSIRPYLSDDCTINPSDFVIEQTPAPGTYINAFDTVLPLTFRVKDKCGIVSVFADTAFVKVPAHIHATITDIHHLTCYQSGDGSATVSITGGSGDITIKWDGDETKNSITLSGMDARLHTVVVSDTNGCEASDYVNIIQPTQVRATIQPSEYALCEGDSVTLYASASGGDVNSYDYVWKKDNHVLSGKNGSSVVVNAAGTYSIHVTEKTGHNCPNTNEDSTATITVHPLPTVSITPERDTICSTDSVKLTAVVPDGSNYTLVWNDSIPGSTLTVNETGIYTLTAIDNNCSSTASASVLVQPAVTIGFENASDDSVSVCEGAEINIGVNYDNADVQLKWVDNSLDGIHWIGDGLWGVVPTNGLSEVTTYSYYLIATSDVENPKCPVDTLWGKITVRPLPKVTLAANSGSLDQTVCSGEAIQNIVFEGMNADLTITWAKTNSGLSSENFATNKTISGTPVLTTEERDTVQYAYTVTATSTNSCGSTTLGGTITVNPQHFLKVEGMPTQSLCLGENIQTIIVKHDSLSNVSVNMGELPYGVSCGEEVRGAKDTMVMTISGTPSSVGEFIYTITATSKFAHACDPITVKDTITVNPLVELSAATNANPTTCEGEAMSDIKFNYSNASLSIVWKDTLENTINQPAGINVDLTATPAVISGTPTTAGVYKYVVSASSNQVPACLLKTLEGTITVNPQPALTVTNTTQTVCSGQAIETIGISYPNATLNQPNLTSYGLQLVPGTGNTATITGVPSGADTVRFNLTASNNCGTTESKAVSIAVNALPTITITNADQTVCKDENIVPMTISLTAATVDSATIAAALPAGLSYSHSTGRITGAPTADGDYSVTVTATSNKTPNCGTATAQISLKVNPLVELSVTDSVQSICLGKPIIPMNVSFSNATLDIVPAFAEESGLSYDEGNHTISGTPTQGGTYTYTLTATSTYACAAKSQLITVTANDTLPLTIMGENEICVSSSLTDSVLTLSTNNAQGYSYAWTVDGGTADAMNTPAINVFWTTTGTKHVTVTVTNTTTQCVSHKNTAIVVNGTPAVNITGAPSTDICPSKDTVKLTATASNGTSAYSFEWTGDLRTTSTPNGNTCTGVVTIPSVFCDTTYNVGVTVTDAKGCSAAATAVNIVVKDDAAPVITAVQELSSMSDSEHDCAFKLPDYTVNGVVSYTEACGTVTVEQSPVAGTSYQRLDTARVIPVTITVTDACGNSADTIVYDTIPQKISVKLSFAEGYNDTICQSSLEGTLLSSTVEHNVGTVTYTWIPTTGLTPLNNRETAMANPMTTQVYHLNVTDENGCTASDFDTVTVVTAPADFTFNCVGTMRKDQTVTLQLSRSLAEGEIIKWLPEPSAEAAHDYVVFRSIPNIDTAIILFAQNVTPENEVVQIAAQITNLSNPENCQLSKYLCDIVVKENPIILTCPNDTAFDYNGQAHLADKSQITAEVWEGEGFVPFDEGHHGTISYDYRISTDGIRWSDPTGEPSITHVYEGPMYVDLTASAAHYESGNCRYKMSVNKKPVTVTVTECKAFDGTPLIPSLAGRVVDSELSARFASGKLTTASYVGSRYQMSEGMVQLTNEEVTLQNGDVRDYDISYDADLYIIRPMINNIPAATCPIDSGAEYAIAGEVENLSGVSMSWTVTRDQVLMNNTRVSDQGDTLYILSDGRCHTYNIKLTATVDHVANCEAIIENSFNTVDDDEPFLVALSNEVAAIPVAGCKYEIPDLTTNAYIRMQDNCTANDKLIVSQNLTGEILSNTDVEVTVKDRCNNSSQVTIKVVIPQALALSAPTSTPVTCQGYGDGKVTLQAAIGGTPDYSYTISSTTATFDDQTQTFIGLTAGQYTVTATDAYGCTTTQTVTVTEPSAITVGTAATTSATCANNDGKIVISGTHGGVQNAGFGYYYNLKCEALNYDQNRIGVPSNNGYMAEFEHLAQGIYTLTVTDANGCKELLSDITVLRNADLDVEMVDTLSICSGGDVRIIPTVHPGTSGYMPVVNYSWRCGDRGQNNVSTIVDENVVNDGNTPVIRTYYVTSSNNNCEIEDSVKVIVNPTVVIATLPDSVCANVGSIDVVPMFSNLTATQYTTECVFNGHTDSRNNNIENGHATFPLNIPSSQCVQDYPYTITYSDNVGCHASKTDMIHVGIFSEITFSGNYISENTVECTGDAVAPHTINGFVMPMATNGCHEDISDAYTLLSRNENLTGCEGTVSYTYRYRDCSDNTKDWVFTYNIVRTTPPSEYVAEGEQAKPTTAEVEYWSQAGAPSTLPDVRDVCGNSAELVRCDIVTTNNPCENTRSYTYTYKDCVDSIFTWTFTYTIKDVTAPTINTTALALTQRLSSENCEFKVMDVTEMVRSQSSDNVVAQNHLIISQTPAPDSLLLQQDEEYEVPVYVTVKDSCDNASSVVIKLVVPTKPKIESSEITHVKCNAGNTGKIELTISGGVMPYYYKACNESTENNTNYQSSSSSTISINALKVPTTNRREGTDEFGGILLGDTMVYIKDQNGCEISQTFTIQSPVKYEWINENPRINVCSDPGEMYATVQFIEPVLSTTANINPSSISITTHDNPGQYLPGRRYNLGYSVSQRTPCMAKVSTIVYITVVPRTFIDTVIGDKVQDICSGESINPITITPDSAWSVEMTGSLPSEFYTINSTTKEVTISGTPVVTETTVYDYTFTFSSRALPEQTEPCNREQVTGSITVNPLPSATVSLTHAETCGGEDGQLTANPSGGTPFAGNTYQYSWNTTPTQNGQTAFTLVEGDYMVTVADAKGCTTTASGHVTRVNPFDGLSDTIAYHDICSEGSFSVTLAGAPANTTYSWPEPLAPGIEGLSSGVDEISIHGTLTNTGTVPVPVTYHVTPTSGICQGSQFDFTIGVGVTVNPPVVLAVSNEITACPQSEVTLTAQLSQVYSKYNIVWMFNGQEVATSDNNEMPSNHTEAIETVYSLASLTDCSGSFPYTVVYSDESGCTNSKIGSVTIVIADQTHWELAEDATAVVNCADEALPPHTTGYVMPVVRDACGKVCERSEQAAVTQATGAMNSCNDTIIYTYRYSACDGQYFDWNYIYIVHDTVKPVIADGYTTSVPANTNSACNYTIPDVCPDVKAHASDNCTAQGDLTVTQVPAVGVQVAENTNVTVTVTDICGNSTSTIVEVIATGALAVHIDSVDAGCYENTEDGFVTITIQGSEGMYLFYTDNYAHSEVKPVGTYTISGLTDGDHTVSVRSLGPSGCLITDPFAIMPIAETLTVTANDDVWTYDGNEHSNTSFIVQFGNNVVTDHAISGSAVTLPNGDKVTATVTGTITNAGTETNVLDNVMVTRGSADVTCYYNKVLNNGELTVNRAAVVVAADSKTKIYGDDDPELTWTASGMQHQESVDLLTVSISREPGDNVGQYVITASGEAVQGNYDVIYKTDTLTITKAALTVTAEDKSKVYGEVDPELTWTVEGLKNGDTRAVLPIAIEREAGNNVGHYVITPSAVAEVPNYAITFVAGDFEITPAMVTVAADAKTKVYGAPDPTLTATVSGMQYGEATSLIQYTLTREQGDTVGNYVITAAGEAVQGNYNVTYTPSTFTITPLEVTVTIAGNTDTVVYDGLQHTVEGYHVVSVEGQNEQSAPYANLYPENAIHFEGTAVANRTDVGTTSMGLTVDNFSNTNPNFSVIFHVTDGSLTINPVDVTVTITEHSDEVDYDGESHTVTGYDVTSIQINGQSTTIYTTSDFTFNGNASVSGTNAGSYDMNLTAADFTNNNSNFGTVTFIIVDGQLVIKPLDVTVTIVEHSDTVDYDSNEHTVSGYDVTAIQVNGQSTTLYTVNDFTFNGNAVVSGTNAGTYNMEVSAADFTNTNANFATVTFNIVDGQLVINTLDVTVTIAEHSDTVDYDGNAHTVSGYDVTSIQINGQSTTLYTVNDFSFSGNASVSGTHAGTYAMNLTAADFTNNNSNFGTVTFDIVDGQLVINTLDATVTITEHSDTVYYDGELHTVSGYDVSSILVNGQSTTLYTVNDFTFSGNATASGTNVGTYAMNLLASNFTNTNTNFAHVTFNIVDGQLVIKPNVVTVTIQEHSGTATYNGEEHTVTGYDVTSILFNDHSTTLYTVNDFTFHGNASVSGTNAGSYDMNLTASDFTNTNANFDNVVFDIVDGQLVINPSGATVTIQEHSDTVYYDGLEHTVTGYDVTSIQINGQNTNLYTVNDFTFSGNASASGTNAGRYPMQIVASNFTNTNPNFANVNFNILNGQLVIKPVNVTVTITEHGDTLNFDGGFHFVNGYDVTSIQINGQNTDLYTVNDFTFSGNANVGGRNAGTYSMNLRASNFANNNSNFDTVTFVIVDAQLLIEPTDVTVTITEHSDTVNYNGAPHTVRGYDVTSIEIDGQSTTLYRTSYIRFSGNASVSGTNAGRYDMELTASDFSNNNGNFGTVTFVIVDGQLVIKPIDATVTITEHSAEVNYNGNEQMVTGYNVTSIRVNGQSTNLYRASDFTFSGNDTARGINAGAYDMNLTATDFTNTNSNFANVTFNIVDGQLVIKPIGATVTIQEHSDTVNYDGNEHTVTGYDVTAIQINGQSTTLYTTSDFTFNGNASVSGTNAGSHAMGLTSADFTNINPNFDNVIFNIVDGQLVIKPIDATVTIAEHSDTVDYNGAEQMVTGYDVTAIQVNGQSTSLYVVSDFTFHGSDTARGTNAGSYAMNLTATDFVNTNSNFAHVTFNIVDGQLVIKPIDVAVTITEHSDTVDYNGTEQMVTGYDVTVGNPLYTAADIQFSGNATAKGTNVGTYAMNLYASDFANTNSNFATVTFTVVDGQLVIKPVDVVVTIAEHNDTVNYDGHEHMMTGYDVASIQINGQNTTLYTENDFTFSGNDTVRGTDVADYDMNLSPSDFTNINPSANFASVTFVIVDGQLIIRPLIVTVTLTAKSDTVDYDATEHTLSGYNLTSIQIYGHNTNLYKASDFVYNGNTSVSGTNVGTYALVLNENDFENISPNFDSVVFRVLDGQLVINRTAVTVTITEHSDTVDYDGMEHTVNGYDVTAIRINGQNTTIYTENDFTFSGNASVNGTNAGSYAMNLTAANFTNQNNNFGPVTFEIVDGQLVIDPIGVTVTITEHSDTVDYDGTEHVVNGYAVTSIQINGQNTNLYTANDFSFGGNATVSGTDAGSYAMNLTAADFTNNNPNFDNVIFNIVDGQLVIKPIDVTVTITEHSDTVDYNGNEQLVTGYDVAIGNPLYTVNDISFSGSDTAKGTNVGSYAMNLTENDFSNTNNNFAHVTFNIVDGQLVINPVEVTVTITEHGDIVDYNGAEQLVTGYDVAVSNPLYTENDFSFSGSDTAKGTNVGTYVMNLTSADFANTNANFVNVTFNIVDGQLVINPVDVTVTITERSATLDYNGAEQTLNGYDVTDVQINGQSSTLYTANDFTFSGNASVSGTYVGTYDMNVNAADFTNINTNFANVTFVVVDGQLVIKAINVTVTITEHGDTVYYSGSEQTVTGYDVAFSNTLYTTSDFSFTGNASVSGTSVGNYAMNLIPANFRNNNDNFATVKFVIVDGYLVIKPVDVNVTIFEHSDTLDYNGAEQMVTGFDMVASHSAYTRSCFTFSGNDTAKGTVVGNYAMNLNASDFANTNANFANVTFTVVDGQLVIAPKSVTVTITEHGSVVDYDGAEHVVTGYDVAISDPLYTENDFVFSGYDTVKGTNAGSYDMNLTAADFTNTNTNFDNIDFQIVDGQLEINPIVVTVTITEHSDTVNYDGTAHSVNGYDVTSIQINGQNTSLYTVADFTFNGNASVSGTNAGSYSMNLSASDFTNTNTNFDNVVFDIVDGQLLIKAIDVTVTITEQSDTVDYDGAEHQVTGYAVAIDNPLYAETDFVLNGSAVVSGTNAGTYAMNLTSTDFENTNSNFAQVTFNIVDGQLVIKPIEVPVTVNITGHNDRTLFDGQEHNVSGYDVMTSNTLYTESEFSFSGTAEAARTAKGTSYMNLAASQFTNTSVNFTTVNFYVTDGYQTIYVENEAVVTIIGHKDTAAYDNTEHSISGYDVEFDNPNYIESYFTFNGTAEAHRTLPGTDSMHLAANMFENTNPAFSSVIFNIIDGYQMVVPADITVEVVEHTDTVMYDAMPHTVTGFDLSTANTLYNLNNVSYTGTVADTTMTGTTAGSYHSTLTASMFSNADGYFNVTFEIVPKGMVIVKNNLPIVITSGSRDFVYDGNAHSYPSYTLTYNGVAVPHVATDSTKFTLPTGDVLSVINPASITYYSENMPNNNTFSHTIENADSYDESAVTYNPGTIAINALSQELKITSLGATWNYDGEAYSYKHYTVQYGAGMVTDIVNDTTFVLPAGDTLTITGAPSIRYAGKMANTFTYTIQNDVLYVGTRTLVFDTLRVNPKADVITITAGSASKVYDGTPLTSTAYSYAPANVLVNGDSLVVEVAGAITNAGDSLNRVVNYKVYRNENLNAAPRTRGLMMMSAPTGYTKDVTDCYTFAVAPVNGVLHVDKNSNVNVTITGHTGEFDYDGNIHSVHGYDVNIEDALGIYSASDFTFTGDDELDESAQGTYNMGLNASQFTNINNNYDPVNFVVNDGWMVIYDEMTTSVNSHVDETCPGAGNGKALILVSGGKTGNPRYSYVVLGANTHDGYTGTTNDSIKLNTLRSDYYTVSVTDGLGVSSTSTFTIGTEATISSSNSTFTCPADIDTIIRHGGCELKLADIGQPAFTTTSGVDMSHITISNNAPADSMYQVADRIVIWTVSDHCGNSLSCEQLVKVSFPSCPEAVDYDGNHYPSVRLGSGCKCWTTENLKSTHYSDGRPINNVMDYYSESFPNTARNVSIFGHLYDWYDAADTITHSVAEIENMYAHGQRVQGVCPAGWYLPSEEDFEELNIYPANELRSSQYWLDGEGNTNATGFNSLPGGKYSCSNNRFEEMKGNAYYWTCHPVYDLTTGAMIDFVCEKIVITPPTERCNGFSIRCVLVEQ